MCASTLAVQQVIHYSRLVIMEMRRKEEEKKEISSQNLVVADTREEYDFSVFLRLKSPKSTTSALSELYFTVIHFRARHFRLFHEPLPKLLRFVV